MTFLLGALLVTGAGWALLAAARLTTGRAAVDAPLGWFAGCAWVALGALLARFGAGLPWGRAVVALSLAAPFAALWLRRLRARRAGEAPGPAAPDGAAPRWWPRPAWLYLPLAAYAAAVALGVALHGANTPIHTDDALRLRAYVPVLALRDDWPAAARGLLQVAGAVPTFVPAVGAVLAGAWDPFDPTYFVVGTFLALLLLVVALPSTRGAPERGWAGAFAVTALPLFAYHCASSYADAPLAMFLGAGVLFHLEYAREGRAGDAVRAALLLAAGSMVKREGLPLAAGALAVLLGQVAWRARTGQRSPLGRAALASLPLPLGLAGLALAVGPAQALPFADLIGARVAETVGAAGGAAAAAGQAPFGQVLRIYLYALLESGNANLLFWILPPVVLLALPRLRATGLGGPLLTLAGLLGSSAASALWLVPAFTLDQSTVHRSLLAASVAGALLLAEVLTAAD